MPSLSGFTRTSRAMIRAAFSAASASLAGKRGLRGLGSASGLLVISAAFLFLPPHLSLGRFASSRLCGSAFESFEKVLTRFYPPKSGEHLVTLASVPQGDQVLAFFNRSSADHAGSVSRYATVQRAPKSCHAVFNKGISRLA